MAEEKKVSDQKPNVFVRIGRWFKNLPGRIAKSFKNMAAELRLVSWPSKKKWIACSVTVLVFVLVMSIVIGRAGYGCDRAREADDVMPRCASPCLKRRGEAGRPLLAQGVSYVREEQ